MKVRFSTRTAWVIVAGVALAWLGAFVFFTCRLAKGVQFDAASSGMRCQVRADIFDPLESEYRIRECTVGFHSDDSIELRIELDPDAQAQAFDIVGEVYELKQKSPILSQKPLELKMWVHDPGEDGQHIHIVNPDSRYGVNLHVYMPGAPDHKPKRDLEEYLELTRKWEEINWQKELDERRAEAAAANPSNADDGNTEEREDDPASGETPH